MSGPIHTACAAATHGLTKRYGRETALDAVDLCVPDGSVYLLVGANGAGKSTTFKLLLNLERPDAGRAEVLGMDTAARGPDVRAHVGYVPERADAGYRWMTCAQLLRHAAAYYPAWDHAYADRLATTLGVRPAQKVGALSKGNARRLQLVLALAHRPPLLLLDEPTDGLDPVVRRRVLVLLAEHLADTPTTVLVATHHVGEMETLADHVGVLRGGRLVAQMPRDTLQRTVRRYALDAPDGWRAPAGLALAGLHRTRVGRELRCTVVGDPREVTERLAAAGAQVREVAPLGLEDAVLALLPDEDAA